MGKLRDLIVEYNRQKDDDIKEIVLSRIILDLVAMVRDKELLPILATSIYRDDPCGFSYHVDCLTHHGTPQVLADLGCRKDISYCGDRKSVFCIEVGQFLSEIESSGDCGMVQFFADDNNEIRLEEEDVAKVFSPQKRIRVLKGDISVLPVDAVVNSANEKFTDSSGGVNHDILKSAGPIVKEELLHVASESVNSCVTSAGKMSSQNIIHIKVPDFAAFNDDPDTLYRTYQTIFNLAKEHNLHVLAIPSLGTGKKGIPKEVAADVAINVTKKWMEYNPEYDLFVFFVTYDQDSYTAYMDIIQGE